MILRKRSLQMSLFRIILLVAFLTVLVGPVSGQKNGKNNNNNNNNDQTAQPTVVDFPQPTADQGSTAFATDGGQPSTFALPTTQRTDAHNAKPTDSNSADVSSAAALPGLSSSAPGLPDLTTAGSFPKITQGFQGIPTYQVIIPNMVNNPYLETSSFPENTVFIIVGIALVGLALFLVGWRALYIYCLHRQTKQRRSELQYSDMTESRPYTAVTSSLPPPSSYGGGGTISMEHLRPNDRNSRVSTFSRPSSARPSTSAMRPMSSGNPLSSGGVQFYSPSAHPGGTTAAALGSQSSRESAHLPPGYYLRDMTASNPSNATASPRQAYTSPSSFLMSDPSAPPMPLPRLSRPTTATSNSTNGGGAVPRPSTSGSNPSMYTGAQQPRPMSSGYRDAQTYNPQARRAPSSHGDPYGGDRRSKPSQVLDELLGGR